MFQDLTFFSFFLHKVYYLSCAAEVKVPVEVCPLLPVLRFEVLFITKTT